VTRITQTSLRNYTHAKAWSNVIIKTPGSRVFSLWQFYIYHSCCFWFHFRVWKPTGMFLCQSLLASGCHGGKATMEQIQSSRKSHWFSVPLLSQSIEVFTHLNGAFIILHWKSLQTSARRSNYLNLDGSEVLVRNQCLVLFWVQQYICTWWWWLLLLSFWEKWCSNCIWNSLVFSCLASYCEWRCLRYLSFCRWWKSKNIHIDLALWLWGPTLLNTHAPLIL